MGRPASPAILKKGKSESKEQLSERAQLEESLKGDSELVYDYIPETLDDIGVKYYKFIVKEMIASGILANLDIPMLTQMADSLSKMDKLKEIVDSEGLMVYKVDRNGNTFPMENPAANTYLKYQKMFQNIAGQFGLSPSSRAQLSSINIEKQAEAEDPLNKILAEFNKNKE